MSINEIDLEGPSRQGIYLSEDNEEASLEK